ncbi:SO_0444 family Cu/Zn efflux transporter [Maridesulfovibrio hydrothermalis]|uniref:SO_0444 family Cu/Zn efflux transporter n=1 Tax=Maridesulfovibrio hydrothermalis TaxID=191026 RepID=UPI000839BAF3
MEILLNIGHESWEVMLQSAPFMLFGFIVAGLLKAFVGPEFISKNLGSGKTIDVIKASILGIPIPLCSCGVIPAAAQLRQQGASKGATTSFLISTPETGVDSIAVTYALLDPVMTFFRPFAAFVTAVIAGILVDRNEKKNGDTQQLIPDAALFSHAHSHDHDHDHDHSCGCAESAGSCAHSDSADGKADDSGCGCGGGGEKIPGTFSEKISNGMKYSFGNLLQDIGIWFLGGVLLAGIFGALIPDGFIEKNLGDGFLPLLIMLAAAIPLYVCATASTPIAAALALKGLSPGAALVFLLAGPATNAASFTVVAKLLGKRSAFIYLGTIIGCSLVLGMFVNWVYYSLGLSITDWVQSGAEDVHGVFYTICAFILLALIVVPKVSALVRGDRVTVDSH